MTRTSSPASGAAGGVRSVHNALTVLETLAARQPIGVSELARTIGLPKSSVQRTLRTLGQAGWAEAAGDGTARWRLTRKVFRIGFAASTASTLPEQAAVHLSRLRDTYGETVHLTVPDGDHIVVVARIDGTNSLRTFLEVGTSAPMASTAGGRAMLGALPPQVTEELLATPVTEYTPATVRDADAIRDRVRTAHELGYATNEAEWREGIAAVAAPVVAPDGRVLGAVSLSMPAARFQELNVAEVGARVVEECSRIADSAHRSL